MKWRVLLVAPLVSILIIQFGMCQEAEPNTKTKADKRPNGKAKVGKGSGKALASKPRVKSTPQTPKAAQTYLTQVVDKGKFQKVGDTLTIQAGDTLEMRCKGNPVQWTVPAYLQEDDEGRLRMIQHERYGTLILANATAADTGEYTCYPLYCEDKDCRKEYVKGVKVFIFFSDPQELFVPSSDYYEVLRLRTNWPTILPCQVTSPLAKVTLHQEFPPMEVKVDGTEISFDNKKGFTIHRPKQYHAGSLYCVASLGNLRQSSTKYMLIYVNYPAAPPTPAVQASSNTVAMGQNLQVTCTVVGEQDVVVDFTWEYPGQKIGRPLYTQDSVQTVQVDGQNRQRSQTVLLVDEIREVDQGTYTCTAQNLVGSRSASTSVKVQSARTTNKPKKL
ncbi:platelet-derived growth factor receptor-like protein [Myxocyprinus asiaticus]|uniref:platelet-derived growth factor receptor-like protein n=1 Tax=Myxocyprinus asiaticus TaxID=70543 RepID=UPI0022228424|nr:platelet-derived growth factor receptor-like protein [Myxocyprinus asiaticus]XP_051514115.1 platelet-derived growth factor receptor-like protein [Myxocyprinus asiaticus]